MKNNEPDTSIQAMYNGHMAKTFMNLTNKIATHSDFEGLPQMVLHEIGRQENMGLKRASFFIESPDFNCMKGVAGFCKNEASYNGEDLWQDPSSFYQQMSGAQFHSKAKSISRESFSTNEKGEYCAEEIKSFGKEIGIENPNYFSWEMKNGNRGILIYEEDGEAQTENSKEVLEHISTLLGLCIL
jgi:hypothetical protein